MKELETIMSALASVSNQNPSSPSRTKAWDQCRDLQIFLGGSCNPTTWRQNIAIPYLETNGISYYNPQVDNWTPEVVKIERHAKQNARVILFVIDRQTRSTVSIIESAYMAGENRKLVMVMHPLVEPLEGCSNIDTSRHMSNYVETRGEVRRTTEEQGKSRIKSSFVQSSSRSSSTSMSTRVSNFTRSNNDNNIPVRAAGQSIKTTIMESSSEYKTITDGEDCEMKGNIIESTHKEAIQTTSEVIKICDEILSQKELQELCQARLILQCLIALRRIPMFTDIHKALNYIRNRLDENNSDTFGLSSDICENLSLFQLRDADQAEPYDVDPILKPPETINIYLSLDNDDHESVEDTLSTVLKEKGLSYSLTPVNNVLSQSGTLRSSLDPLVESANSVSSHDLVNKTNFPQNLDINTGIRLTIERDIGAMNTGRVLLFVITNKCRGLSVMVLASHFMALSKENVVLCVQDLEEPCSIDGELLTKSAIADYNRGRVYLCDYAVKSQVPVFRTIHEAIECCSRKCRHKNNKD